MHNAPKYQAFTPALTASAWLSFSRQQKVRTAAGPFYLNFRTTRTRNTDHTGVILEGKLLALLPSPKIASTRFPVSWRKVVGLNGTAIDNPHRFHRGCGLILRHEGILYCARTLEPEIRSQCAFARVLIFDAFDIHWPATVSLHRDPSTVTVQSSLPETILAFYRYRTTFK